LGVTVYSTRYIGFGARWIQTSLKAVYIVSNNINMMSAF